MPELHPPISPPSPAGGKMTWAERLGSTISPGLNKNVLEIVLIKEEDMLYLIVIVPEL